MIVPAKSVKRSSSPSTPTPQARSSAPEPPELQRAYPSLHRFAAAQAVLAPLCGSSHVTFPPRLETVTAFTSLWNYRVRALRQAGCRVLKTPGDFGFARCCPPYAFALIKGSKLHPCHNYRVCPFCFALQVELLYENVRRALRRHPGVDLYVNVLTKVVPLQGPASLDESAQQERQAPRCLAELLPVLRGRGRALAHRQELVVGAVSRTTIAPSRFDADRVVVRHATLIAVPRGKQPPGNRSSWVSTSGAGLARGVGHMCRYPVELLFGDPERTARVLNALPKGQHLGVSHGIFRSARSVTAIEQIRDQPLGPAVPPEDDWCDIAEEEPLLVRMPADAYDHEQFAVHALLDSLGLLGPGNKFADVKSLPLPVSWVGQVELTMGMVLARDNVLRDLVKPHRSETNFALVFLAPGGQRYMALSTLPLMPADSGSGVTVELNGRRYVIEPLGQFAVRLRGWRAGGAVVAKGVAG